MRVIRLGDRTSHGGEVITAASDYVIMDKEVALEDDICTCPIPGHGSGGIIGGDRFWTFKGRAVALQGPSVTHCGAEIFSSCGKLDRTFEGDGEAGGFDFGTDVVASPSTVLAPENTPIDYDEHFILIDKRTGELLEDWDYQIHALGQSAEGATDSTGKTGRVGSDEPEEAEFDYAHQTKIGI